MRQEAGRSAKTKAAPKAPFSKKALEQTPVPQSYDPPIERDRPSTLAEYSGFQAAFEHFNKELFGDSLPDVLITLRARGHSHGYFSPDRFSSRAGRSGRSELALNPDVFVGQTDKQVCQTLAHELCHVWQHHFGTPAKNRYHNKEWGSKMKAVGLMPSNTGAVGGRETGQQMLDYILPGGPFELSFHRLEQAGWRLNLQSAPAGGPKGEPRKNKAKFSCPECGQNAWGRPDLAVTCTHCEMIMPSAERS